MVKRNSKSADAGPLQPICTEAGSVSVMRTNHSQCVRNKSFATSYIRFLLIVSLFLDHAFTDSVYDGLDELLQLVRNNQRGWCK